MNRIEFNLETGEEIIIALTAEEIAYTNEQKQLWLEEQAARQAALTAKQTALAKLMALGLTEEEALALGVK
jgi:hypothetical protein